jgi:hypothetical protein
MASIVDEMMAREGTLDPDIVGINHARAADLDWTRERGETERAFLARVVRGAAAAGFRVVQITGALQVDNVVALRRPDHLREVGGGDAA